jgi:type II restriction enzyme
LAARRISAEAIARRNYWVSEIVKISGTFGDDADRVEKELDDEVAAAGIASILDHLRLCGAIPESYGHDTSEEKLYSKYTDVLLAIAFRAMGMTAIVFTQRADTADVEVAAQDFSFVADAKAFRLRRTAKNPKDFKVQAMHGWKQGKKHAIVVGPLYQFPTRASQIYQQAISSDVCIMSYAHLAVLVSYAQKAGREAAQEVLLDVLEAISSLNPTKDSLSYWRQVNDTVLRRGGAMKALWSVEKEASVEALATSKKEALEFLASERERIMRLSHDAAIKQLIEGGKLASRQSQIEKVADTGLLEAISG